MIQNQKIDNSVPPQRSHVRLGSPEMLETSQRESERERGHPLVAL